MKNIFVFVCFFFFLNSISFLFELFFLMTFLLCYALFAACNLLVFLLVF